MIQAIIFDCFGVLVRSGYLPFVERNFKRTPYILQQATDMNDRMNAGHIHFGEYVHNLALLSGLSEAVVQSEITTNPPNDELFGWIRDHLKPSYKIGLLSNASEDWPSRLFEPLQLALFDEIVLSYQVGVIKPDPTIYRIIVDKLGLNANECLFIDDQQRYCDGAEATGMSAILYKTNAELAGDLAKYNIFLIKG